MLDEKSFHAKRDIDPSSCFYTAAREKVRDRTTHSSPMNMYSNHQDSRYCTASNFNVKVETYSFFSFLDFLMPQSVTIYSM